MITEEQIRALLELEAKATKGWVLLVNDVGTRLGPEMKSYHPGWKYGFKSYSPTPFNALIKDLFHQQCIDAELIVSSRNLIKQLCEDNLRYRKALKFISCGDMELVILPSQTIPLIKRAREALSGEDEK